ncbi:hypothetical protein ILUMI_05569, partial [Ignelater luminosus]
CNVANREEVMKVAQKVRQDVGDVTILINNAGVLRILPFLSHTSKDIQTTMDINVMAHFWTLQAFLPNMVKNNHGHIVALSSLAGFVGLTRNLTAYSTSKFAVRGMMEALYNDLHVDSKCRIKTTCVYPTVVDTALLNINNFHMKYPKILPILKPKYVAECIMNAQRRDMFEVTLPRHMLIACNLLRLLPTQAAIAIFEFLDCYLGSDSE